MRLRVGDIARFGLLAGSAVGLVLTTLWIGLPVPTTGAPTPGAPTGSIGAGTPGAEPAPAASPGWTDLAATHRPVWGPLCQPGNSSGSSAPTSTPEESAPLSFQVTILSGILSADAGVPIPLESVADGGSPPYKLAWNDSLGLARGGADFDVSNPVPANVSVTLTGLDSLGETAEATAVLHFVPPPAMTLSTPSPSVDVGVPFGLVVQVDNGVPPIHATWAVEGGSNGTALYCFPGRFIETVGIDRTGPVEVVLNLTDYDGRSVQETEPVADAYRAPTASIVAAPVGVDALAPYRAQLVVVGGAPPVDWSAAPSVPVFGAAAGHGVVSASGLVNWTAEFRSTANGSVAFAVVDAVGQSVNLSASVNVTDELTLGLTESADATLVGRNLTFNATVGGGVPPYSFAFLIGGVPLDNGSLASAGIASWNFTPTADGTFAVAVRVQDAVGASTTSSLSVEVALAPASPVAEPAAAVVAAGPGWLAWPVGLGLFALVGTVVVLPKWRRRKGTTKEGTEDERAPAIVRRLLEESPGLDRETLYFRTEDEGLGRPAVTAALDEWRRQGRISTRPGSDGEELLGWTDGKAAPPSEGGTP